MLDRCSPMSETWGTFSAARRREVPACIGRSLSAVLLAGVNFALQRNFTDIKAFLKFGLFDSCKNVSVCIPQRVGSSRFPEVGLLPLPWRTSRRYSAYCASLTLCASLADAPSLSSPAGDFTPDLLYWFDGPDLCSLLPQKAFKICRGDFKEQ